MIAPFTAHVKLNMEASSLSVIACDVYSESDTKVTYADVVKKVKDIPQYQVEDENAALNIALEQSMAKVYRCLLLIHHKMPSLSVCRKLS